MKDINNNQKPTTTINPFKFTNLLKNIPKCPDTLYIRGNPEILNEKSLYICIVGSRRHTEYGRQATKQILKTLQHHKPIIVSGLASGIDTIALETALDLQLKCIAVLGGGLDDSTIYPVSNISLAHKIIDAGGLLISEYPDGTSPQKWTFPMRNRIMAGLSDSVVIIEGNRKSGTLITARLGLEYGRTVICVPGSIFSELSSGPLSLIAQGAHPLTSPEDILTLHNLEKNELILRDSADRDKQYKRCTPEEQNVFNCLHEQKTRDELIRETKYSIDRIQIIILTLEIKGLVEERLSKIVRM